LTKDTNERIFPIITTEQLVCRQITANDAAILHQYWSDSAVTEHFSLESFQSIEETLDMIALLNSLPEKNEGIRWAITRRADNKKGRQQGDWYMRVS
jgi:[ribosomal protein S5]-alanine N-acetyltransferase